MFNSFKIYDFVNISYKDFLKNLRFNPCHYCLNFFLNIRGPRQNIVNPSDSIWIRSLKVVLKIQGFLYVAFDPEKNARKFKMHLLYIINLKDFAQLSLKSYISLSLEPFLQGFFLLKRDFLLVMEKYHHKIISNKSSINLSLSLKK